MTGTSVSLCWRCRGKAFIADPPLILFWASKGILCSPEGRAETLGKESIRDGSKGG